MPTSHMRSLSVARSKRAASTRGGNRKDKASFERLITHLATQFINVPIERLDEAVDTALAMFGGFAELHRASILLLDEQRARFARCYEWCAPGVKPGAKLFEGAPLGRFRWFKEHLFAKEIMLIRDAEDLPAHAHDERLEYRRHGVGSSLVVPMHAAAGPLGCLTFAVQDLKEWSNEDIALVRIAAEMFVNVFERKRTEEVTARYAEALERSNRDLEDFAYHASHDLQEPLRMVAGYCEMLRDRYGDALEVDARNLLEHAVAGARRMKELIDALLEYSRASMRRGMPHQVDCNTLMEVTLENLGALIEETGARITHDRLPTLVGDGAQLGQLFQNLISNAIKFSHEGGSIEVRASLDGDFVKVSVQDEGIGIEPKDQQSIFDRFRQIGDTLTVENVQLRWPALVRVPRSGSPCSRSR